MDKAKPFCIAKRDVWEAYKRVKANQGAAGVDGQSIAEFDEDLSNNLYRLWNRMSSGTYFPPPVRRVDIPKGDGRTRPLGIPTVSDRIAQMVVKRYLEPIVEPVFHRHGHRAADLRLDAAGGFTSRGRGLRARPISRRGERVGPRRRGRMQRGKVPAGHALVAVEPGRALQAVQDLLVRTEEDVMG